MARGRPGQWEVEGSSPVHLNHSPNDEVDPKLSVPPGIISNVPFL